MTGPSVTVTNEIAPRSGSFGREREWAELSARAFCEDNKINESLVSTLSEIFVRALADGYDDAARFTYEESEKWAAKENGLEAEQKVAAEAALEHVAECLSSKAEALWDLSFTMDNESLSFRIGRDEKEKKE